MLINGKWYNPASGRLIFDNRIRKKVIIDVVNKKVNNFFFSFSSKKNFNIKTTLIRMVKVPNILFNGKKKFINNVKKPKIIIPNKEFSEYSVFL